MSFQLIKETGLHLAIALHIRIEQFCIWLLKLAGVRFILQNLVYWRSLISGSLYSPQRWQDKSDWW